MPTTHKIFLSHSNADRELVLRVAADLAASRLAVWLDRWELRPGESIIDRINEGISESSHLVVFLSPTALASSWVKSELNAGLMRELSDKTVAVICALLPGCRDEDVPPLLRDKLWLDFRHDYLTGVSDLFDLFRRKRKSSDLLFQRGTECLAQDRPDKAIPLFKKAIEQYQANYDAVYNLAAALQRTGEQRTALPLFEQVSSARPKHALYRATLGRQLVDAGELDRGISCLREAANVDENDSYRQDVLLTVALGLQAAGLHEEALPLFESYLAGNADNGQFRYLFARSLREAGQLLGAVKQYRLLMREDGNRPAVLIDFAATLVRVNDPETNQEAIDLYEHAMALAPDRPEPHEFLAQYYFDRGRITDSLTHLRVTLRIEPTNVTAQYNLASVLAHLGRSQEAIAEYYRVLELAPTFKRARAELAQLLSDTPSPTEVAILPLVKIQINPVERGQADLDPEAEHPLNYDLLQSTYVGVTAVEWDASIAEIERLDAFVDLVTRTKEASDSGVALSNADELAIETAISELEEFQTHNRGADVRRHDLLGILEMRRGALARALVHFRTSVGLFPYGVWTHVNLGLAYSRDGQLGRAVEEWELALALGFENCDLRLHIGFLLNELGLVPQAQQALTRFLELCPEHRHTARVRSLLERLDDGAERDRASPLPPAQDSRQRSEGW